MSLIDRMKSRFSPPPSPEPAGGREHIPFLVSWNLTKRCNLKCAHCYLDAAEIEGSDETDTEEAKRFIDEVAGVNPQAMLIMTGGEPLLRPDFPELARYASGKGLTVVVGTNGTLLDDSTVDMLMDSGVQGVGISLDSATPVYHDRFRGVEGAWQKTVDGMEALKRRALPFQLQLTVTRENRDDIPALIEFAAKNGAKAVNIFFLVCTGRGQEMTDLKPEEYEATLKYLAEAESGFEGRVMVRARCAPHFLRVVSSINPESAVMRGQTSGCIAGTGYMRISPEGDVTPCPYIPAASKDANLKRVSLREIWDNHPAFVSLRTPQYNGRCKDCEFNDVCGGCRARALSSTGDLMGEDPWCTHEPDAKKKTASPRPQARDPVWTDDAKERLGRVPVFLRGMVKKGVERYAAASGIRVITPDVMSELRKRAGR